MKLSCDADDSDEEEAEEEEAALAQRVEALKEAIKEGNVQLVEDLLENGADIQHRYANGLTPLHLAVVHERLNVVRLLVLSRADPLAKTTDDVGMTPLDIANLEGQQDIFNALCEEALPHPFWRRFAGPLCLLLIVAVNGGIFLYLNEANLAFQTSTSYKNCIIVLAFACIVGLIFANFLDPGTVQSEDVAYVQELRRLPSAEVTLSRTPAEDETFHLLPTSDMKSEDPREEIEDSTYRWCRTCHFWRPPGVSHCAMCGKCFWRMDHHCWAIGNCVALHNHRFFSGMVTSGAAAWLLAAVAVAMGLEPQALLHQPTWPMLLAVAFIIWSMLALSVLVPFAGFHLMALLCNVTSKSTCGRRPQWQSRRLNRCSEYRQIFCSPVELRPCEGAWDESTRNVHLT